MNVDFNNLRKRAVFTLEKLTRTLNESIVTHEQFAKPNGFVQETNIQGYVLIEAAELESDLNHLISMVNSIACVGQEGNHEFRDLTNELPENIVWFNPESED